MNTDKGNHDVGTTTTLQAVVVAGPTLYASTSSSTSAVMDHRDGLLLFHPTMRTPSSRTQGEVLKTATTTTLPSCSSLCSGEPPGSGCGGGEGESETTATTQQTSSGPVSFTSDLATLLSGRDGNGNVNALTITTAAKPRSRSPNRTSAKQINAACGDVAVLLLPSSSSSSGNEDDDKLDDSTSTFNSPCHEQCMTDAALHDSCTKTPTTPTTIVSPSSAGADDDGVGWWCDVKSPLGSKFSSNGVRDNCDDDGTSVMSTSPWHTPPHHPSSLLLPYPHLTVGPPNHDRHYQQHQLCRECDFGMGPLGGSCSLVSPAVAPPSPSSFSGSSQLVSDDTVADESIFGRGLEGSFSSLVSQCGVLFSTSLHEELLEGGLLSVPPLPPLPLDHDDVMEDSCGWLCLDNLVLKTKAPPTHHTLPKLRPIYREEETDDTLLLSFASVSALPFKFSQSSAPDQFLVSTSTPSNTPTTSTTTTFNNNTSTTNIASTPAARFRDEGSSGLVVVPPIQQQQPHQDALRFPEVACHHRHEEASPHYNYDNGYLPHPSYQYDRPKVISPKTDKKRYLLAMSLEGTLLTLLEDHHSVVPENDDENAKRHLVNSNGCGGDGCDDDASRCPPDATLTVTHHQKRKCSAADITPTVVGSETTKQTVNVYYRPHIAHFFTSIAQHFDIAIFSVGEQDYVDALLDVMDPSGQVFPKSRRYYRQHCTKIVSHQTSDVSARRSATFLAKDLQILGRPLNEVVLIDDIASSGFLQPSNLMLVPTWRGDPSDITLIHLTDHLVNIAKFISMA